MAQNYLSDKDVGFGAAGDPVKTGKEQAYLSDSDVGFESTGYGLKDFGGDLASVVTKGAMAVPQAAVGLADIATGGRAGKALEDAGVRFNEANQIADSWKSDALKAQQKEFQDAEGIGGKAVAALSNPGLIASTVAESIPSMFLGGALAKGAGLAIPALAGRAGLAAAGEGAVMAGSQAENIRQQTADGLLTPGQSALAAATGVAGGAIGALGAKAGKALGVGDIDTMIANGASKGAREGVGLAGRVGRGALAEGVLEELPQSLAETAFGNIALDKPVTEGMDEAAVLGTLSGGVMGGAAGAMSRPPKPSQQMGIDPGAGPLSRAAAASVDSQPVPQPLGDSITGTVPSDMMGRATDPLAAQIADDRQQAEAGSVVQASPAAASDPVPLEQRSLEELRQAFRSAQDPAIRKTLAAEIRKRREAMPDPLAPVQQQQEIALEPQAPEAVQSQPQEAPPTALGKPLTETGAGMLGRGADPLQSIIQGQADARRAADVLRGTRNSSSGAGADIADAGVANDVGSADGATGAAAPVVPQQGQPGVGERPAADQAALRPDGWRTTAIKAGKVARSLGLDPKGKRLKEIVAEIDAVDEGTNVQNTPSSTAGTEAKASPVEARAPEGGNGAANTGVPAAPGAGDVQADGVKEAREETAPASQPKATELTPKQFHEAKLSFIASESGADMAEVREMYDAEGGRAEHQREWLRDVEAAAKSGETLSRQTLDKLYELAPNARLPETATPNGYQRPEARKAEAKEKQARIDNRKAAKASVKAPAVQAEKPAEPVSPEKPEKIPPLPVDGYRIERNYANGAKIKPLPAKSFTTEQVKKISDWFKSIGWTVTSGTGPNGVNATNDVGMTSDDIPEPYTAKQRKQDADRKASDEKASEKSKSQDEYLASTDAGRFVTAMFGDAMNKFNSVALAKFLAGDSKTFDGMFSSRSADVLENAGITTEGRAVKDVVQDLKAMFSKSAQPKAERPAEDDAFMGEKLDRYEAGKKLTKEQRLEVLKTLVDVYKQKGADREVKGVDQNGNERFGYVHSPDLFEKSDVTGSMVRYFVTMPDGSKAHPTELFPDYSLSDIEAEMQRREQEERDQKSREESRLKVLQSRVADSLGKANLAFNKQNPGARTYVPATLTNGTKFVRTAPETALRDAKLLGDGWEVQGDAFMGDKDKSKRQGTPVDRAIMDMAGEGREANEILSFIAKSSKSPYRRQLAQKLLATGANPAVSLGGEMGGGAGFRFLAKYSRKNHEVTLSEAAADRAEQIFLHETVHAATLLALDKGGLIATQMNRLYESVKAQGGAEGQYGLKNVGEFVAEAFTNPDFQKALKGMKADNGSLWDRLVNIVRRILGMEPNQQDALSAALDLGAKVMRENMPLRAAKSFRAEDGPAFMRSEDTRAAFDARIDELFANSPVNRVGPRVLDRSDVMSMLGYEDKPVVLSESKVIQSMENHPEMTAEVWKKIPGWLENPAAVFDSDTDGGLVVIAPEMVGGKAVSIIVRPDGERRNALNVHLLLNAYSRSPNTPYQRWISQGLLRYVDQKKFPALFEAVAGRQLPGTALQNKPGTKRILTEKNLVGWRKANPEDEANFGVADAVEQIKQFDVKSAPKSAWAHYRGMALQTLGRRQLVDLYGDEFGTHLHEYDYLVQQMDAEKNETGAEADDIAQRWGKLKDEKALAELMHDATLAKMDPDKPMPAGYSKSEYEKLKTRFNTLSPEAKTLYREARDMYIAHYKAVQQAIKDRIERSEMSPSEKKRMMAQLDDKLFKELQGVYFPLARFGQYVIVVKDANGEVKNVTRAETVKEAEQARKELQKAFPAHMGNTVGKVLKQAEFNAGRDAVGKGFMADLMNALDEKGVDDELRDTVAQLYLSSLPDLSWAKHGIHRKGTPGFSQDARRAFAQNSFHGARYLAKLRYSDRLQDELAGMQEYVKAFEGVEEYDSIQGQQVVDEMVKRHEWLMNPKASPVSTALTSFGFLFHMGLSPASAMVNLTQTALVAFPQMGAKWGFTKAGAALTKASEEVVRAKNDLSKSLKGDELSAFERAVKDGTIDVTMAHDLAGIAQGEDQGVMWKVRPVMRWASFMFHHAEKFNRQATFLAAYRLAKESNPDKSADWHYEEAKKATYDGHFDYSAANRARVMQGNWQRVILLFKQYSQAMIYTLARNAYQSVKALDPKERSQARKTLGGILAAHAAAAGVLGLPIVGPLLTVASWIGGDDDEPWDAEVAMQNAMAEMIGPKAAEVVARGFSRLTPFDLSGRVALNKLILPDVQEGLEGKEWAESAMAAALGPVAGIGVNMARGSQKITEGDYLRGLEDMMPTALRGPLKAMRYAGEGAVDKTGITITEDVSAAGVLGQASGFSPSQVRRDTERRSAIYSYDRALLERRSVLMRMFAQAQMSGDTETAQEVRQDIQRFNEKNPTRRITPMNLAASIRNRRKRIEEAEQGVYLPSKRRDALDAVTF